MCLSSCINIQWGLEYRTFEYRIHSNTERFHVLNWDGSDFEWSVHSYSYSYERTIRNPNKQNGRSKVGRFIKIIFFFIYIKQPRLAIVRYSNGPDHSKTEQKMADHSKTERHSKTELCRPSEIRTCSVFEPPL